MQAATATETKKAPATKKATKAADAAPVVMAKEPQGEIINWPWNKTVVSILNSRGDANKHTREELEGLAALIHSQTILQNLIGFKQKKKGKETGIIEIVAGGGRHGAVGILIERSQAKPDYPLPIKIVSEEEAIAASIAENMGRKPPHLGDEILSMKTMIDDQQLHPHVVAAAFGLTMQRMNRRLALATVSPRLFELFRTNKMSYEQITALTLTTDHATQEQLWDKGGNRSAWYLREVLTKQKISTKNDHVARFIGVKAYEKAGGTITRDLFSDNAEGLMDNPALLEKLAVEKLEKEAEPIRAEGWKWVEVVPRADYTYINSFERMGKTRRKPTEAEQKQLDQLVAELEKAEAAYADNEDEDKEDELSEAVSDIEQKIEALEASLQVTSPEEQSFAGVVIRINSEAKMDVIRGLIRPEDRKAAAAAARGNGGADDNDEGGEEEDDKDKPIHSDRLTRQLTSHRTAALQAKLMNHPNIALVVMTHRMAKSVFSMETYRQDSTCQLSIQRCDLTKDAPDMKQSKAWTELQENYAYWKAKLPKKNSESLFMWLLEQSLEDVLKLMALCVASSIDTIQLREADHVPAKELATALELDMADWWNPTADGYFAHVSKARIAEVISEAVSPDVGRTIEAMKKKDAAAAAEKAVEGKRWIPEMFRIQ